MYVKDFVYQLPQDLIAAYPCANRRDSRLLCLESESGVVEHRQFQDMLDLLNSGDLLVLNNTRVIPARLYGHKESGGRVEILVERIVNESEILAQIRSSKKNNAGTILRLAGGQRLKVLETLDHNLFHIQCIQSQTAESVLTALELLEQCGHMPLPPYMERADEPSDRERYQTVYAREKGAVAAPTAGLHFDLPMLEALAQKGVEFAWVTLHVGLGTFQPLRVERLSDHIMHRERIIVSEQVCRQVEATRARGARVIAVGTTSVRCLESAAFSGTLQPYVGETDLFIYPGFSFRVVDAMITNFHVPASTLLMLVCAFAGKEQVMGAYAQAIAQRYRFYSYGDAMWIAGRKIGQNRA